MLSISVPKIGNTRLFTIIDNTFIIVRGVMAALVVLSVILLYPGSHHSREADIEQFTTENGMIVRQIRMDPGGDVAVRKKDVAEIERLRGNIRIELLGKCASSCGLLLKVRKNMCYYGSDAEFWFHRPFNVWMGIYIGEADPWKYYLDLLPSDISAVLIERGFLALPDRTHYIKIPASQFISPCIKRWGVEFD